MNTGIYSLTNEKNGKRYIGQSRDLKKRKTTHFWALKNNRHPNKHLQRAWNLGDTFRFEIIEECAPEECNEREIYWIERFGAFGENGYNMCRGGDTTTGRACTEETKRKISNSKRGRKASEETIRRRTASLKKHMEEDPAFREKVRERARRMLQGRPAWNKGKPCSEERKRILSEANKGRVISEEHKEKLRELYSGENSLTAKLTKEDVVEIRYRFANGERQIDIAKDYPVTNQTIYDIVRNRRWKSVPTDKKTLEAMICKTKEVSA